MNTKTISSIELRRKQRHCEHKHWVTCVSDSVIYEQCQDLPADTGAEQPHDLL